MTRLGRLAATLIIVALSLDLALLPMDRPILTIAVALASVVAAVGLALLVDHQLNHGLRRRAR